MEFWPDVEDLSPEELEEWAAKAQAAMEAEARTEPDYTGMVASDVQAVLAEQERAEAEALFLLMVP